MHANLNSIVYQLFIYICFDQYFFFNSPSHNLWICYNYSKAEFDFGNVRAAVPA